MVDADRVDSDVTTFVSTVRPSLDLERENGFANLENDDEMRDVSVLVVDFTDV